LDAAEVRIAYKEGLRRNDMLHAGDVRSLIALDGKVSTSSNRT